ncbi:MAG TPA: DUF6152 family protein [Steroidobacteraceae bacterium]
MRLLQNPSSFLRCARLLCIAASAFAYPFAAQAHHSPYVHYESRDLKEIEGEVVGFEWRNPHTRFDVKEVAPDGTVTLWNMEYSPPAILLRQGVTKDRFQVGTKLKFAGFKAKDSNTMFITNILFPDGTENYNDEYAPPRWTAGQNDKKIGEALIDYQKRKIAEAGTPNADGIFRVWANDFTDRTPNKLFASAGKLPLTAYAQQVKSKWDPVKDNLYIFCKSGMPSSMDQVHPMQFSRAGEDIQLKVEEYDVVRTIHMKGGSAAKKGVKAGPNGYSVGHWEGDTLVVLTSNIDYPWFDKYGTPQSPDMQLEERFSLTADKSRLDYTLVASDPKIFTAPVTMKRQWIWVPGEVIKPYNCQFNKSDLGLPATTQNSTTR